MKRTPRLSAVLVLAISFLSVQVYADLPTLIPRETLFGNPERSSPQISPDGKRLAWIAPDKKNVLQVWVKTVGKDDDKIITADKKRGIRTYSWARDNKTVLYPQDNDGDENFHVYGVDLESGNVRDYTPIQGVRASITAIEPDHPETILVSMNARDCKLAFALRKFRTWFAETITVDFGQFSTDSAFNGQAESHLEQPPK